MVRSIRENILKDADDEQEILSGLRKTVQSLQVKREGFVSRIAKAEAVAKKAVAAAKKELAFSSGVLSSQMWAMKSELGDAVTALELSMSESVATMKEVLLYFISKAKSATASMKSSTPSKSASKM